MLPDWTAPRVLIAGAGGLGLVLLLGLVYGVALAVSEHRGKRLGEGAQPGLVTMLRCWARYGADRVRVPSWR